MAQIPYFISWLLLADFNDEAPLEQTYICFRLVNMATVSLSYLNCVLGKILANSRSWRIWQFDNRRVKMLYFGLWEVFFIDTDESNSVIIDLVLQRQLRDTGWVIPDEIWYGQDIMTVVEFINIIVMIFASISFYIIWNKKPYTVFICSCFRTCVWGLLWSCACTAFVVSWNFKMDLSGKTELNFPKNFLVEKSRLIKKHFSYVFPLGLVGSTISLVSAVLYIYQMWLMRPRRYIQH